MSTGCGVFKKTVVGNCHSERLLFWNSRETYFIDHASNRLQKLLGMQVVVIMLMTAAADNITRLSEVGNR
jgi:hypothetical protein